MKYDKQELTRDFLRIWSQVKIVLVQLADSYGLTMQQTYALYAIWEQGSLPMNAVATRLHCDASNVTGIVDRLVNQQLVERREDAVDRRAKVLTLTAKGNDAIAAIVDSLPYQLGFDRLTTEDCQVMAAIMGKLRGPHEPLSK